MKWLHQSRAQTDGFSNRRDLVYFHNVRAMKLGIMSLTEDYSEEQILSLISLMVWLTN